MVLRNSCVSAGNASRQSSDSVLASFFFTQPPPNSMDFVPGLRDPAVGEMISRCSYERNGFLVCAYVESAFQYSKTCRCVRFKGFCMLERGNYLIVVLLGVAVPAT